MGVTKASDMFSFGLVVSEPSSILTFHANTFLQCMHAMGGGDLLILNCHQELLENGLAPEQETLVRHFCYFGPVSNGFLEQTPNEDWRNALKEASRVAELAVSDQPELKFEWWRSSLSLQAQDMLSELTKPDPTARLTIGQVMSHQWWQETD